MNEEPIDKKIRRLLGDIPIASIATVSDDGTPLCTPVFGTFNDKLHLVWASAPEAEHSKNIVRDGKVFAVVYDPRGSAGLYLAGRAEQLEGEEHIYYAYNLLQEAKQHFDGTMGSQQMYMGAGPQRFYRLVPEKIWVNEMTKDDTGAIVRDERVPVEMQQALPEAM